MEPDRLFLVKNCPECAKVRAELKQASAESDAFLTKQGRRFLVISAMSSSAGADLLSRYGIQDKKAPVLLTGDGVVLDKANKILAYMVSAGA